MIFFFPQTFIFKFEATDADSGKNAELVFKAIGLDEKFEVTAEGELWARQSLDGVYGAFEFNLTVGWLLWNPMGVGSYRGHVTEPISRNYRLKCDAGDTGAENMLFDVICQIKVVVLSTKNCQLFFLTYRLRTKANLSVGPP